MIHVWILFLFVACGGDGFPRNALDIAFLIDSSSQVLSATNFNFIKQFAIDVMSAYDVGLMSVRVSVATFSGDATLRWNLTAFSTQGELQQQIANLQLEGGDSNVVAALRLARQTIFTVGNGDRPTVPNVAFLILGSRPNNRFARASLDLLVRACIELRVLLQCGGG